MDQTDRKILVALLENGSRSYADLAKIVHLSPPAIHERVRRLKRDGVIRGTTIRVEPAKVGRPLLAFVRAKAHMLEAVAKLQSLTRLPAIEEIHELTGEAGAILKVRARDSEELKSILKLVQAIDGCEGTITDIVLSTIVERGTSAEDGREIDG